MLQTEVRASTPGRGSVPTAAAVTAQMDQYLTFVLSKEVFALGILAIKEIIEYTHLTEVPMTPAYVRGVINLRGAVVPVLDLSVRFGKERSPVTKRTCIVIIEINAGGQNQDFGVVVDTVNAVLDIPSTDIESPPSFGTHIRTDFIHGMAKVSGRFVILLDVDRILAAEEVEALAQAGDSAPGAAGANG